MFVLITPEVCKIKPFLFHSIWGKIHRNSSKRKTKEINLKFPRFLKEFFNGFLRILKIFLGVFSRFEFNGDFFGSCWENWGFFESVKFAEEAFLSEPTNQLRATSHPAIPNSTSKKSRENPLLDRKTRKTFN
jgi:hypothetical protein